jgi:hypothetical protein
VHSDPKTILHYSLALASMLTRLRVVQLQAPPAPPSASSPRLAKPARRTRFHRPRLSPRARGGSPPHAIAAPSQLRLLLRFRPTPTPRGISPSQLQNLLRSSLAPLLRGIAPSQLRLLLHSRPTPSPPRRSSGFSTTPPRLGLWRFLAISSSPGVRFCTLPAAADGSQHSLSTCPRRRHVGIRQV